MDFKKIEAKWRKIWEKQGWYPAVDFDSRRKKLYVLVEFPYPSGSGLHVGHAFTMTGADVYARKKRMEGYNVLFPMGWDAFGLPTENYAIKTGIHPKIVTKKNTDNFRRQMKRMAFSFDWSREINTTDPQYYHWTQWIFIQLFKHGLAYKKKMPINWCPACKIGLANEEVVNGKCERCGAEVGKKELSQWIVKITDYADRLIDGLKKTAFIEKVKAAQINWIGRSEGAKVKFLLDHPQLRQQPLEVFTTRPDTLWGATFMVVAPEHWLVTALLDLKEISQEKKAEIRRYLDQTEKKTELERSELTKDKTGVFTSLYAINPVNQEKIPVWIADFVLASYGTGAIMAVPAHDQRDWQFAQKYHLPIVPVVEPEEGWDFNQAPYLEVNQGRIINSGPITGLTPSQAIKKVISWLQQQGIGQPAVSYHLRDWIFSRQHYWGEPIPMIYCSRCAEKGITWWDTPEGKNFSPPDFRDKVVGWFPLPEEELPLELPEIEHYQPTGTGESPLAAVKDWLATKCPYCGASARRETDTMPNWAGSDWYFLRYLDPHNRQAIASKKKMQYWLPVDIYIGGDEHNTLHLLYSRFIYQFLWEIGAVPKEHPEPYYKRLSHGVILGADGQRMSKSRGNVVNPDEVADQYGVDVLRTYMMFMGPFEGTMAWNDNALRGVARFLKRFEKFIIRNLKSEIKGEKQLKTKNSQTQRVALNKLIKKVTNDIDHCSFNTAIAAMMEFLNQAEKEKWSMTNDQMKKLLQLIAPFAPYLAEELWFQLDQSTVTNQPSSSSVHLSSWPKSDPRYLVGEEVEIIVQVNGKLRAMIKVAASEAKNQARVATLAQKSAKVNRHLAGRKIKKIIFIPEKLINFVV